MFADIDGTHVHYTRQGKGETAVLVHGWGGTGRSLQDLAGRLARRYCVLTVDLPGFGASDNPDASWGVGEYAAIIGKFIKKESGKPVIYFGHSFGGALGLYLAANDPGLISHLIVAAASFHRTEKKQRAGIVNRLPIPELPKLFVRKMYYKLFYPRSDILNYPRLEKNYRAIVSTDLTGILFKVRQPTLILWGDRDRDTPVADARLLKEKIPGSKLVVFPGVSHNLPLKHAEAVEREIEKFI